MSDGITELLILEDIELLDVVVVVDFLEGSLLVSEEASVAVWAVILLVELLAKLGLIFGVLWFLAVKFIVAMSELTFATISALS